MLPALLGDRGDPLMIALLLLAALVLFAAWCRRDALTRAVVRVARGSAE